MSFMNKGKNIKPLPSLGNHICFGCSPVNPSGLQMKFYKNEKALLSWLTVPEHLCGWNHLVHGGIISTMLDEIMSWSAITMLKRIILTKSISVEFKKPVYIGNELMLEGKVREVKSEREALMEGFLYNQEKKLCARSEGTFALFTPDVAIRMGIMSREEVRDFEPLLNS